MHLLPYTQPEAVDVDGLSIDVFHYEIGLAVLAVAGVEEFRNIRMRERRQNLPLGQKSLPQVQSVGSGLQEFYRNAMCDLSIHPVGRVNRSHASPAKDAPQPVHAARAASRRFHLRYCFLS